MALKIYKSTYKNENYIYFNQENNFQIWFAKEITVYFRIAPKHMSVNWFSLLKIILRRKRSLRAKKSPAKCSFLICKNYRFSIFEADSRQEKYISIDLVIGENFSFLIQRSSFG
jgi:hypothetical protein